jgi:predicted phosphodiesterase
MKSYRERSYIVNYKIKKSIAVLLSAVIIMSVFVMPAFTYKGAESPRRISVAVNGDATTSKGFCWYTDIETGTEVQIYKAGADVTYMLSLSEVQCKEWQGAYMHKVKVSGLEAGVEYTYRVGDGYTWSDLGKFVTDDGDDSLKFITISDVQASNLENFQKGAATLYAAFATMPDAEFVVNCGDFTNDSTNEEWDYYDEAFYELNLNSTIVPVTGNHDGANFMWNWFDNMFCLDTSESVQTLSGVNYSYDYGNAHFAVVNTNDLLSMSNAQLTWLKNDLNSTNKDWKIVFMHKSPYSLGKDAKWPDALYLQDTFAAILDECGVDLVMSGHDHMYIRTKALYGNEVCEDGTVYVLAGTAGSKRYEVRSFLADSFMKTEFIDAMVIQKNGYGNYWNGSDWDSTDENNIGGCFSCVSIDGGTLTLNAYILSDNSGIINNVDTLVITKETGQNEATFFDDNTTDTGYYLENIVPSISSLAFYAFIKWLPKFIMIVPNILDVYINDGIF